MKLIVTGGAGFIGSAVVRLAVARGHEVVNVDALTYAACLDNVAEVADSPNYAFEHADIRDRAALDRIFAAHGPDAVMHLAAESHVDRFDRRTRRFSSRPTIHRHVQHAGAARAGGPRKASQGHSASTTFFHRRSVSASSGSRGAVHRDHAL